MVSEVVVSLDTEKKIDRIEWNYLPHLKKNCLWPKMYFLDPPVTVYASPKASVITNKMTSKLSICQAIEPLSIKLQTSMSITGIKRNNIEHRLSLYADDLMLYISDPMTCVPKLF